MGLLGKRSTDIRTETIGERMIISFSVFRDKIKSGEKKQTIRRYNEKRFQWFTNAKKYQLYWGNPRNGGTLIKEVDPIHPYLIRFDYEKGVINTGYLPGHNAFILFPEEREELARADGFTDYNEMIQWFMKTYGTVIPFNEKFMVLRWR